MPSIEVIINAAGGSFVEDETQKALEDAFAAASIKAKLTLAKSGDEIVEAARASTADILVGGGGDGTVSAVAAAAIAGGKVLGVLPLGTLNHFAKDIGIPEDLGPAVAVIGSGHIENVDVGELNGRVFVNNSSIGLYPRIVHRRELLQERLGHGKWSAAFFAALQVFRRHAFLRVHFDADGSRFSRKAPFVFVGNNKYVMDLYNIGGRESLSEGKLSVYFLRRGGRWGIVRLVFRTLFGMLETMKEFEALTTEALTIDIRKKTIMVALDGEVDVMQTPLEYKILPRALSVIVPRAEAE